MLNFYYAPDTCSLATHLALVHVGALFKTVRVDISKNDQNSSEFLQVNPLGRVPVLVTEDGSITETPALLLYLAQRYSDAYLAPIHDPYMLAVFNSFNSYLCSTVHIAHSHRMRGYRWADEPSAWDAMRRKVPVSVAECFSSIEKGMMRGPWVLGQQFSASDYYLLTLSRWLELDGVDVKQFPRVSNHRSRMMDIELVKRVISTEESQNMCAHGTPLIKIIEA